MSSRPTMVDEASAPSGASVQEPAAPQADSIIAGWPCWEDLRLRYLQRVLEHTQQNKTQAVKVLGIDRRTLNRILARERRRGRWPL